MKITEEMVEAMRRELKSFKPDEQLRAALTAALAEQTQQGVEVKGLEWKPDWGGTFDDIPEWRADTPWGRLTASVAGHRTPGGARYERHHEVPDELKSKLISEATVHYEAKVRSALVDVPAVESEPVRWQRRPNPDVLNTGWVEVNEEDIPHYRRTGQDIRPLYADPPRSLSGERETSHSFSLEWVAGARPPVHPKPMRGRQSFRTFDLAVAFMGRLASDAEFVSLTEHIGCAVDRSADARTAISAAATALPPVVAGQMEIDPEVTAADLGANAEPAPETCERCQGNGEIVTDWDRYRHPHLGDKGDEAVADCPTCDGTGKEARHQLCRDCDEVDAPAPQTVAATMDSSRLAIALEAFAREQGFVAPPAHYILGEFSLTAPDGTSLYTDEAHLWCEACAEALVAKALPLLPEAEREDHPIYRTDADGEDSCPHCRSCGETLTGSISAYAIEEEIAYYSNDPINPTDTVNPRQAVEIAQLLWAAPSDERALKIGQAALEAIRTTSAAKGCAE